MIDASQSVLDVADTSLAITISAGDEYLTVKSAVAYTLTFPTSAVTAEFAAGEAFGCNVHGMAAGASTATIVMTAAAGNLGKVNVLIESNCGTAGV